MANGIIANSILNALAGLMLLVTGFASTIITARILGPEANGIIAFSLWLVMSGASIAELGSSIMLLKMMPQLKAQGYDAQRRKGFAAVLITPTLFATVVLTMLYGAAFLTSEELHWAHAAPTVALVTAFLFIIQSIGSFSKFYLIGEKRLGSFFKLTVLVSVLQLGGVLGGALLYGVEGALVGYALGQVVLFIATAPIIFARRDRCDVPRSYLTSSSLIISLEFILDSVFLNRIELLFLQQFWTIKIVGFYAVGLSLANMALQIPIQLTGSLLPYYSERRHENGGGGLSPDVIAGVTRSLSYITLPIAFGLAGISEELVATVFGEPFRESWKIAALLALAAPGAAFMQTLSLYLLSMDRVRERLVISIAAAVIMVAGCFLAVPLFGGEGAAAARIFVFIAMCVMMIKILAFGSALNNLYVSLIKVGLASAFCAAAAWASLQYFKGPAGLLAAVVLGAAVYLLGLRVFSAVASEDAEVLYLASDRLPGRLRRLMAGMLRFLAPRATDPHGEAALDMTNGKDIHDAEGAGRAAAYPVVFDNTLGHFQPEDSDTEKKDIAVLILSPWGYDEMCVRKSHRIFAERLAAAGIASLRFDFPGTGDADNLADFSPGLALWEDSIVQAAGQLRILSRCDRLVLVGQGLGATLGHRTAPRLGNVAGIALLAPVTSGRTYLREVGFRSKFIYEDLGLKESARDFGGISIAGLKMPDAIATEVKAINIGSDEKPAAPHYLVFERQHRLAETALVDALQAGGAAASQEEYVGYDYLMTMPLTAREPVEVFDALLTWLQGLSAAAPAGASILPEAGQILEGEGFREQPLRFGEFNHLTGVACMPADGQVKGRSVLLLSTAYDRHSGWGRTTADIARELARRGVMSLRYDSANIADSPPRPGEPDRVLYQHGQNIDASAALDLLEALRPGPLMVAGRCSGGYLAFRSGVADPRVQAVVAVNPFVFYWDPDVVVPEDISVVPRSLDDYGNRMVRMETVKRLFSGQVNIRAALRNMVVALMRRLSFRIAPLLMRLPGRNQVAREVRQSFEAYQRKNVPVTVMYSEGDVGLEHLYFHFGADGKDLKRYGNVDLVMLADADHNLTPPATRKRLLDEILRHALPARAT